MRVVAVSGVKNESDIIEAFVRHTLTFVDRLVVLENGSTDETLAVLRALEAEGLPLDVVEDPSPGMYQAERMTRLLREWAVDRNRADWVLPLDADEFVGVRDGGALIPPHASTERPIGLRWRSYVPLSGDNQSESNPVVRIRHRLRTEAWPWAKVIVPRALAARPNASLVQGNHELLIAGQRCAWEDSDAAFLGHFPMRSPGQYLAKIAMNSLQYLVMPDRRVDAAWHYREPYELLRRDPRAFLDSFFEAARSYQRPPNSGASTEVVPDPFPYRGGRLRYTPPANDEVRGWLAVLGWAEDLARRQAALVASLDESQRVSLDRLAAVFTTIHGHCAEQHQRFMGCQMEIVQLTRQLQRATDQVEHVRHYTACHLERALRQSWTWRTGHLILSLLRPLQVLIRWGYRAFVPVPRP